jgi:hypothetical protein
MTMKPLPDRPDCPHCGRPMATYTSEYWRCRQCREKQRREISPERARMLQEKNRERYRASKDGTTKSANCISNSVVWYRCQAAPEDGLYRVGQYYRSEVVLTDKRERVESGYKFIRPDGKAVQW